MFFINFLSLLDHFQAIKKNVIEPLMASGGYPDLSGWTTKKNMCFFPNMQKKTTFSYHFRPKYRFYLLLHIFRQPPYQNIAFLNLNVYNC